MKDRLENKVSLSLNAIIYLKAINSHDKERKSCKDIRGKKNNIKKIVFTDTKYKKNYK